MSETTEAPLRLRGAKFLSVVAGDAVGERIDFEVAGLPCWVRLAPAPTPVWRAYQFALLDFSQRGKGGVPADQQQVRDLTAAEVELAVASIKGCQLARKAGDTWQTAVPPEVESQQAAWLRDLLLTMNRDLYDLLMLEVQVANGAGPAEGNSEAPTVD